MSGRILTIAESDSSGSAGIQADIKTILALGGHALTAISTLTAQKEDRTTDMADVPAPFIAAQMRASLPEADAVKIGFLPNETAINTVADMLDEMQSANLPVVVDPSFVSRKGDVLVDEHTIAALKRRLYLHATILTPNLREAEVLCGMDIKTLDDTMHAADMMRTLGVDNIVLKARQAFSNKEVYVVATDKEERVYEKQTLQTTRTLGAGSTFSTTIAVNLVEDPDIFTAVENAMDFLQRAMEYSPASPRHPAETINHAFHILETTARPETPPAKFYKV